MDAPRRPSPENGKICYVEIPSKDIDGSARFYRETFGWNIRKRGDGQIAFDDGVGQVSGTWVLGKPPASQDNLLVYIMVEDMRKSLETVVSNGGKLVQEVDPKSRVVVAKFSDPSGNIFGLYQEG